MGKDERLGRLLRTGLVAILRADDHCRLGDAAAALAEGGVDVVEVTFTVPKAERVLAEVADRLGDRVLLGAGTILDAETARIAIQSGAEFLVSPAFRPDVIRLARRYGKLVFPGAFTPTEVLAAWEAGADIVKVFPSDTVGPAYLKALRAPLPQIRLMPTGGVTLNTAADFLRAGACALGVGGALVEARALAEGDFARIQSLARQFVEVVSQTRAELGSTEG
ncbi:MAG: bifunctional 4-hydroxy-2-oxoglutarate aldolase/2-dehydro-3-deoxy-phosphogluconate aldolase [Planctomycetia bacterium]|nr:bifunctional 4-hydroxy-2-oxoglutarate aldolase/2-dehydro-3-deoxy-phosphogluconate aldolase [Planctomycetia bacterium]